MTIDEREQDRLAEERLDRLVAKLEGVKKVISHGYPDGVCPDGMAAAMIVKDALPDVAVHFAVHNTSAYDRLPAEPGLLFVDITPPLARVEEFRDVGAMVLDHHKDKEELVDSFGEFGFFAHETRDPGVSGALLAFDHVWSPLCALQMNYKYVRSFAKLAGIRDTWQTSDPLWLDACAQAAALCFVSADEWLHDSGDGDGLFEPRLLEQRLAIGSTLLDLRNREAEALVRNAYHFTTPDRTRVMVLASTKISDAAEASAGMTDIVVGFSFQVDAGSPVMRLSFRSKTRDVAVLAKCLGGGGHTSAAGAVVPLGDHRRSGLTGALVAANPYAFIYDLIPALLNKVSDGSR